MSGKLGKFLIGAALFTAGVLITGPGIWATGTKLLKALFTTVGFGLGTSVLRSGARQGSILQTVIDTQAPLPVVYGRTKLGIRLVDKRCNGDDNKDLYIVGALCHGSEDGTGIAGIDEIYFDDRLAIARDGTVQAPYVGLVTVTKYLGTDAQTVDPTLNSVFPVAWPSTSNGRGIAYLVFKLIYDAEKFATGEPTITAIVRGAKVKDPASLGSAATYSTNPSRCSYDLLASVRYGNKSPASEINAPEFATMATYYDSVVTKNSDLSVTGKLFECNGWVDVGQPVKDNLRQLLTSARAFPVYEGGKYRIFTRRVVTPTTFTLSEANILGDWTFSIPGVGAVPNTMRANYIDSGDGASIISMTGSLPTTVMTRMPHGRVVGEQVYIYQFGTTAQGLTPEVLGFFPVLSTPTTTTFTIQTSGGGGYVADSCRAAPPENFPHQAATRVWPRPNTSNGYLTADNDYEVIHDIDLPFTNDPYTTEQIALVELKERRAGTLVGVTATEAALTLQVGDLVPLTHSTPGWSSKNFWVMAVFLVPDTGQVRLSLLEYDAAAYSLDVLGTVPTPPSTSLPNPFTVSPPSGLVLTAGDTEARSDIDGTVKPYIQANWTASPHPYLDYYEVQARATGSADWLPAPDPNRTDLISQFGPVTEGKGYDFRVRAVNTLGIASVWIESSVTPALTAPRQGSAWVDDFGGRWEGRWNKLDGAGTFRSVSDPDSGTGACVGRATGPAWLESKSSIQFDPSQTYVMEYRVRQLRAPGSGETNFYLGVAGVVQSPGQPDVFQYVNRVGVDRHTTQHYVLSDGGTLTAGRGWTVYRAYIKGYAGGTFPLTSAMVSHVGLGSFSAANLTDGNTTPSSVGFSTDSAVAGASLNFDLGSDQFVTDIRLHMAADGSTASWELEFADDAAGPWTRYDL